MATFPQTVTYRDARGETTRVSFFIVAATEALASTAAQVVIPLLDALTNAANQGSRGAYSTSPSPVSYGATAQFESSEDKAMVAFTTNTGALHRYQVPAPKAAIFLADLETVNPAQADVAAFTAAVIAQGVSSRDGADITTFIGGIRIRKKLRRRVNIYTLAPNLTIPAE